MNKQREVIYKQRREVLERKDIKNVIVDMLAENADIIAEEYADDRLASEEWDWEAIRERFLAQFGLSFEWGEEERKGLDTKMFADKLQKTLEEAYGKREQELGSEAIRHLERVVLLQIVDTHWKEHLLNMDHLKEGIGLRGYGQKNPLNEYKREGFEMFMELMDTIKLQTVSMLFRVQLVREEDVEEMEREHRKQQPMELRHGQPQDKKPVTREGDKIGRNAPCPCGSGKKYKRCCGKKA